MVETGLISITTAEKEVGILASHQSNKRKADDGKGYGHSETKLFGFGHDVSYIVCVESVKKIAGLKGRGPRRGFELRLWCHY